MSNPEAAVAIVQQAVDRLPADHEDRGWLLHTLQHRDTTPMSVLAMAVQTSLNLFPDDAGDPQAGAVVPAPSAEGAGAAPMVGNPDEVAALPYGEDVEPLTAEEVETDAAGDASASSAAAPLLTAGQISAAEPLDQRLAAPLPSLPPLPPVSDVPA